MKKTKRITAMLLAACMAFTLGACGGSKAPEADVPEPKSDEAALLGGWEIYADEDAAIPSDAQEALEKALEGYTGMNFEAKALLATQVVSGTNYAFLCLGERVVQNPEKNWYVVAVYKDLQGGAKITSVEAFDLAGHIDN